MNQPRALVIDDEPDICELLKLTLGRMDIETETAADIATAKTILGAGQIDICLTDMRLPDGDGLELVEWMQTNAAEVPVAVITAHGNVETAVKALKLGAFDFISKPLDLGQLRSIVENALKVSPETTGQPSQLIGRSHRMQELREMVDRVARSQAPVHISGESGTGKELVARLIHDSGPRGDGPFVPVNCGAVPAELMESEFFGHRKGSFTGAIRDKIGLMQSADGGTLFLDEIADLPLPMQVKLLRVIQEKTVRPVGASREESVNARILSATHRNLGDMVASGAFREDLYYRINVIELHVPALRDRGDDCGSLTRPRRSTAARGERCSATRSRATCVNSRTCSNVPSHCARAARSARPTCTCDHPAAPTRKPRPSRQPISATRSRKCSARRSSRRWRRPVTTRPRPPSCSV
jgi:two-component system response regulator PilR (NtrC family)